MNETSTYISSTHLSKDVLKKLLSREYCLPYEENSHAHSLTKKLVLAVDNEHEPRVRTLLKDRDAPVACVTELGPIRISNVDPVGSVVHLAANRGLTKIIEIFLDFGVNVDLRSLKDHATPLLRASRKSHLGAIRILIGRGANVNVSDNLGRTPLHFACASGNIEAMCVLIDLGANVDALDSKGYLPTQLATLPQQKRISEFLNFKQMRGLHHGIVEPPSRLDSIYGDDLNNSKESVGRSSRDDQSERRSGIFEAARKAQMKNYNFFDDKLTACLPIKPTQEKEQETPKKKKVPTATLR